MTAAPGRVAALALAAVLGAAMLAACGGGGDTGCDNHSSTFSRGSGADGRVVVDVTGDGYCRGPVEVLVVSEPSTNETLGMQVQNKRFAVIAIADGPSFHRAVTLDSEVKLQDGTALDPASQPFEILVRQQKK